MAAFDADNHTLGDEFPDGGKIEIVITPGLTAYEVKGATEMKPVCNSIGCTNPPQNGVGVCGKLSCYKKETEREKKNKARGGVKKEKQKGTRCTSEAMKKIMRRKKKPITL